MAWCLLVVDGADLKQQFPLPEHGKVLVGKDPSHNCISLNDFYLEKSHCTLNVAVECVIVQDTSRERGVFVNGVRIVREARLTAGDVLRVGNTHLRLELYDGPPPTGTGGEPDHVSLPLLPLNRLIDLQGHTLGHYEIGLTLGKGHHGIVFRAQDLNNGSPVALKVLSPEFPDDSGALKKFAQMIKTAGSAAKHPNLVHWRGAGKTGPYVWIAQDLIDGENLKSSFSQPESSRWSWRGAWRLVWEIGLALDHLHRQHVAHGNVTDANLLMTESGKAMLNDLRFKEAIAGSSLQRRVHKQKFEAELPFCPPERLEEGQFVDEYVADIYSLGVATYVRLSCGMYPFQGASASETTNLILNGVSDKHRRRAPAAPDDFLDVLYKMLARTQEDRYQNTAALLTDLERFKNVK